MSDNSEKNLSELDKHIVQVQKSTRTLFAFMAPINERLRLKYHWYYKWHLNPLHARFHWFALLLNLLIVGFIYATSFGIWGNLFKPSTTYAADCPGGSGDVTISSNTSWPAGDYACTSLTVNSGANLTIAGNTTVTLSGALTITGNSKITASGNTTTGTGVTINANSTQIDDGSSVDANGRGFGSGGGLGAGANYAGGGGAGGGAYGGGGGNSNSAGGTAHGSIVNPTSLGSGGGAGWYSSQSGSNGGGAIILSITGNATINGTITANGTTFGDANWGGAGSGGSVNLTVGTLLGSTGTITANGGSNNSGLSGGGGGGGRIAITYTTDSYTNGIASLTKQAYGGGGAASQYGAAGTIYLKHTGVQTNGELIVDNNNQWSAYLQKTPTKTANMTVADSLTLDAITLRSKGNLIVPSGHTLNCSSATYTFATNGRLTIDGTVNWPSDSITLANGAIEYNSQATLDSVTIQSGGVLTHSMNSTTETYKLNLTITTLEIQSGGSINVDSMGFASAYGTGTGGNCSNDGGGGGGGYGGNGGSGCGSGGSGGIAYGSITNPISLGSGGGRGWSNSQGGNNGGGAIILNITGTATINGAVTANGTTVGSANWGGAGSGGSVNLTIGTLVGSTGSITANGGSNSSGLTGGSGGGGRIAISYTTDSYTGGISSLTKTAYGGTNNQIGGAGSIYIKPASGNGTLTYNNNNANGAKSNITATMADFGATTFGDITISGAAKPSVAGNISINSTGTLTLSNANTILYIEGANTANDSGGAGVAVNLASLVVNTGTIINADGAGYTATHGEGRAVANSGGGHGGAGGTGTTGTGGGAYGSSSDPITLGSGGGGGAGGGAIKFVATGTITVNGTVTANGVDSANGAGAGGSINLNSSGAVNINSGTIRANGGAGSGSGAGGGGGRISIVYLSKTWSGQTITANAGTGGSGAANGSIYIPPAVPTMNAASDMTTTSITWNWTDNSDSENQFIVYDAADDSELQTLSSTTEATTGTTYSWTETVTPGQQYQRYVKARDTDSSISSAASNSVSQYSLPNAPNNLSLATNSTTSQTLTFGSNSNDSTVTYSIYDNATSLYLQANGTLGASAVWQTFGQWNSGSVTISGLSVNTSHNYKIKAKNGGDTESGWSANSNASHTRANVPGNLSISTPQNAESDTLFYVNSMAIKVKVQANSNPASTQYAISVTRTAPEPADAEKFVQTPSGGNAAIGTSEVWKTYAEWGGASGVTITGLTENNSYTVKVKARNGDNVDTAYCGSTSVTTPLAPVPPATLNITDTSNIALGHYRLTLDWTPVTNLMLDYYIVERSEDNEAFAQLATTTNTFYIDSTTQSGETYYYRIKTHTNVPDTSVASSVVSDTVGVGPIISNLTESNITDSSTTLAWTTDLATDTIIEYGKTASYGQTAGSSSAAVTTHAVVLSNLDPETTYHYRVRARLASGKITLSEDQSSTTTSAVYPIISSISSGTPGITTATITWTTDILADSIVEYGPTASYGYIQGGGTETLSHSVTLVGLSVSSTYHFRVKSRGSNNNLTTSPDYTFTTSLLVETTTTLALSNVNARVSNDTTTEAVITWDTNAAATSQISYGITESLGSQTTTNSNQTLMHYQVLTGLTEDTRYYYRVKSVDASDNEVLSEVKSFTTPASETPSLQADISAVAVSDITLTSAIISWRTSTVTTSIINLGVTDSYGTTIEDQSTGATTIHTVRLSDLVQGTAYHFRIKGISADNREIASDDYIFSTLTMPAISNIEIKDVTAKGATITWKTNTETDSFVDFSSPPSLGGASGGSTNNLPPLTLPNLGGESQSQGRSEEVKDHAITLVGLHPATSYTFRLKSRDKYGNVATSEDQTLTTVVDVTPPAIKDMKSETSIITDPSGESKAQAIVSWSTDEPSTAQIQYTLGVAAKDAYQFSTPEDQSLSNSHIMVISNLAPSATYHMRILAKDAAGNISASDDYTVLTLKQETTLVQYIVQILEERFSWVKNLGW